MEALKMENNQDILNSEEIQAMTKQFAERLKKEEKANEVYETFLKSCGLATMEYEPFKLEGKTYQACKLGEGKVELKSEDYPDYYGGAYINDEGNLVIHVLGELDKCQAEIEKVCKQKEGYVIKQARYCYKDLMKIAEDIDTLVMNEKQKEVFSNVTGYGPSDRENLFLVELNVLDESHIKAFKEQISDSDMIMFKKGELGEEEVTVRPGRTITRNNTNTASTLTIRARRNLINGFVLSGHAARNAGGNGNIFRFNGVPTVQIGTVARWQVSGSVDAAFCNASSGVTLSNLIHQNSHTLLSTTTTAGVGTTINLAGQISGIRPGQITHVNYRSTNATSGTLVGSKASYSSHGGDSGGPIYRLSNNQRRIVGVHARSGGFFTLIAPVMNALGISLW